ncbi:hypothetical protein [Aeromonas enteropelogenes]
MRAATDPIIKAQPVSRSSVVTGTPCPFPVRHLEVQHARSN